MPVYNEAAHLEAAIESLVAQDYTDWTLHISDNASTDGTGALAERFAASDPRIRYQRLPANIGAAANFRHVLGQARGEYFMWAGGHDLWSPNLLGSCVAALDANQDAVLAFATSQWIDGSGKPFGRHYGYTDTSGLHVIARLFTIFWGNMHPILGVIRASSLGRTGGFKACIGADLILLSELALQGDFIHARHALWQRREPRGEESQAQRLARYSSSEYGLSASWIDRVFPLLRLPLELVGVVMRSPLGALGKLTVLFALLAAFPCRYLAGQR
jgi:glycosyltransferase involved in cell wall biosynthesis